MKAQIIKLQHYPARIDHRGYLTTAHFLATVRVINTDGVKHIQYYADSPKMLEQNIALDYPQAVIERKITP